MERVAIPNEPAAGGLRAREQSYQFLEHLARSRRKSGLSVARYAELEFHGERAGRPTLELKRHAITLRF